MNSCIHQYFAPIKNVLYDNTGIVLGVFVQTVTVEGTDTEVQFVFIDTVILVGPTHPIKTWLPPSGPASVDLLQ